ncbi:hypothetical protein QFZ75_000324 [Streptomyces sp. V3I8]|nr:hypothetical protein [Streptomyces sp. V3I8]
MHGRHPHPSFRRQPGPRGVDHVLRKGADDVQTQFPAVRGDGEQVARAGPGGQDPEVPAVPRHCGESGGVERTRRGRVRRRRTQPGAVTVAVDADTDGARDAVPVAGGRARRVDAQLPYADGSAHAGHPGRPLGDVGGAARAEVGVVGADLPSTASSVSAASAARTVAASSTSSPAAPGTSPWCAVPRTAVGARLPLDSPASSPRTARAVWGRPFASRNLPERPGATRPVPAGPLAGAARELFEDYSGGSSMGSPQDWHSAYTSRSLSISAYSGWPLRAATAASR